MHLSLLAALCVYSVDDTVAEFTGTKDTSGEDTYSTVGSVRESQKPAHPDGILGILGNIVVLERRWFCTDLCPEACLCFVFVQAQL